MELNFDVVKYSLPCKSRVTGVIALVHVNQGVEGMSSFEVNITQFNVMTAPLRTTLTTLAKGSTRS